MSCSIRIDLAGGVVDVDLRLAATRIELQSGTVDLDLRTAPTRIELSRAPTVVAVCAADLGPSELGRFLVIAGNHVVIAGDDIVIADAA